jgi:uncharacterized protein with FMN-binding domain
MCAVTGLVVVANLRAGARSDLPPAGVQATGVVLLSPATHAPTHPAVHKRSARPASTAKRSTTAATHRPSPTSAPTRTAPHRTTTTAVAPKPAPKPSPTAAKATSVVVNGRGVYTRYGVVQVQITISQHRITKATAIAYPHGSGQTDQINAYAVPQLNSETLQAQSAQIDTVSGATYTSNGYRSSLQSALDSAHAAGVW